MVLLARSSCAGQPHDTDHDQGHQGDPEQEVQRGDHQRDNHERNEYGQQYQDQTSHSSTLGHLLVSSDARYAAATRLGTTIRQASRTSSAISACSMAPSLTCTQL